MIRANAVDLASDVATVNVPMEGAEIKRIVGKHSTPLGKCLSSSSARKADILLTISGKLGRVTDLEVNGLVAGPLHACLLKAVQAIAFAVSGGGQTHARFMMGL